MAVASNYAGPRNKDGVGSVAERDSWGSARPLLRIRKPIPAGSSAMPFSPKPATIPPLLPFDPAKSPCSGLGATLLMMAPQPLPGVDAQE